MDTKKIDNENFLNDVLNFIVCNEIGLIHLEHYNVTIDGSTYRMQYSSKKDIFYASKGYRQGYWSISTKSRRIKKIESASKECQEMKNQLEENRKEIEKEKERENIKYNIFMSKKENKEKYDSLYELITFTLEKVNNLKKELIHFRKNKLNSVRKLLNRQVGGREVEGVKVVLDYIKTIFNDFNELKKANLNTIKGYDKFVELINKKEIKTFESLREGNIGGKSEIEKLVFYDFFRGESLENLSNIEKELEKEESNLKEITYVLQTHSLFLNLIKGGLEKSKEYRNLEQVKEFLNMKPDGIKSFVNIKSRTFNLEILETKIEKLKK